MEMIQLRIEIRGMWFPEKPSLEKSSIAGSRTKDLTLCLLPIAPNHIHKYILKLDFLVELLPHKAFAQMLR
jgi:hypothetical protein